MSKKIDPESLPENALCPPEQIDAALVEAQTASGQLAKNLDVAEKVRLLLSETQMQQQQQ
jgi:hypothetical protein